MQLAPCDRLQPARGIRSSCQDGRVDSGPLSALAAVLSGALVVVLFDVTAGAATLTALALFNIAAAWLALMIARGAVRLFVVAGLPGLWVLTVTLLWSA